MQRREGRERALPFPLPPAVPGAGISIGKDESGGSSQPGWPRPPEFAEQCLLWNLPRRPSQSSSAHRQILHTGEQKDQVRELDPTPCLEWGPNSFHGSH